MSILFPVVPNVPGVPPVLREASSLVSAIAPLLTQDSIGALLAGSQQWGVYNADRTIAIACDSFVGVDVRRTWSISDYPVEKSSFNSINKVQHPDELSVILAKGGTPQDRRDFLLQIKQVAASTDLYSILMPEGNFASVSIVRYEFRRAAANGVSLLLVNIGFESVRVTATSTQSSTTVSAVAPAPASPIGSAQVNTGVQQAIPVPPKVPTIPGWT